MQAGVGCFFGWRRSASPTFKTTNTFFFAASLKHRLTIGLFLAFLFLSVCIRVHLWLKPQRAQRGNAATKKKRRRILATKIPKNTKKEISLLKFSVFYVIFVAYNLCFGCRSYEEKKALFVVSPTYHGRCSKSSKSLYRPLAFLCRSLWIDMESHGITAHDQILNACGVQQTQELFEVWR
ncbi:MAG TPA: hypothetical protein DCZ95_09300 [Verrucomicrobia bacterium]|nr:MAG: hypothetical protein A2X46_06430 [Lentisphaerae bacterium GWF2_57_35]HBA84274.1 hypothetical protein [Verrucomicrobiota bacterium]